MGKQIKNPLLGRGFQLIGSQPPKGGAFVPALDSVVNIPEEVQFFYYDGPTVEGYTHGYFYERRTDPAVYEDKTYTIPPNTEVIEILQDGLAVPRGVYTYIKDYPQLEYFKQRYNNEIHFLFKRTDATASSDGQRYELPYYSVAQVGDYVWNLDTHEVTRIAAVLTQRKYELENGAIVNNSTGGYGSVGDLDPFVSPDDIWLFAHIGSSWELCTEFREHQDEGFPPECYGICPAIYRQSVQYRHYTTTEESTVTVHTLITPERTYFVQADTQPRNTDYKLVSPDGSKYIIVENTGTTIAGNVQIVGDLTVQGIETVVEVENVRCENNNIDLRYNNPQPLGDDRAGIVINNYDGQGTNLVLNVGSDGVARVGDQGDEQPLMTRDNAGNLTEGVCLIWDATHKRAVGITLDDLFAKYVQSHTMTEAEYWAAVEAGTLKANNLYFTPVN